MRHVWVQADVRGTANSDVASHVSAFWSLQVAPVVAVRLAFG
jgi:hypothetical protein